MPNDNVPKEQENDSGEALSKSDNTEKGENKMPKETDVNSFVPNNYDVSDIGATSKDIKIEDKELYKLKERLDI